MSSRTVRLSQGHGLVVTLAPHTTSMAELVKGADVIWTDAESVKRSAGLKDMLAANASVKLPRLFIVHSDSQELTALEPALSQANNVVLAKRPIYTHGLVDMFQNNSSHADSYNLSHRVRFALPTGKTPIEERKVELGVPEPGVPVSEPEPVVYTVLLVEDNMVSVQAFC